MDSISSFVPKCLIRERKNPYKVSKFSSYFTSQVDSMHCVYIRKYSLYGRSFEIESWLKHSLKETKLPLTTSRRVAFSHLWREVNWEAKPTNWEAKPGFPFEKLFGLQTTNVFAHLIFVDSPSFYKLKHSTFINTIHSKTTYTLCDFLSHVFLLPLQHSFLL